MLYIKTEESKSKLVNLNENALITDQFLPKDMLRSLLSEETCF